MCTTKGSFLVVSLFQFSIFFPDERPSIYHLVATLLIVATPGIPTVLARPTFRTDCDNRVTTQLTCDAVNGYKPDNKFHFEEYDI